MVSVCVITYNHEPYIEECLNSIIAQQTNFDFEIVIGEDGSPDNTRSRINEKIISNPGKIKLLPDEGNLGMMPNFIRTLKACKNKYLAICEGDDYWSDPKKLQKQVDFLEDHPHYSACFTNTRYLQNGHLKEVVTSVKSSLSTTELIEKNHVATQTVMYKNEAINIPAGFEKLQVGDWPLHVLVSQYGDFAHLNEFTAVYRVHPTNVWQAKSFIYKLSRLTEATEYLYKNLQPQYKKKAKKQLIKSYYSLISHMLKAGKKAEALSYYYKLALLPGAKYTVEYLKIFIKLNSKDKKSEVSRN